MSGTCTPLNASTAPNWPDVPFYLYCPTSTSCATPPRAPSFFSTARLTSITVRQWSTTAASHVPVDSYALSQSFPATADGLPPRRCGWTG
jgi:hypothetical protein